jgi:hypothetical protein
MKRFDSDCCHSEDPNGDFVLYEEAAEIEYERGALKAEVEALRKLCGEVAQYVLLMDIPDAMASDFYERLRKASGGTDGDQ